MYQELIKQELVTAQQALADFIADAENINAIEQAAKLIAASLRDGGKVMSCGMAVLIVMPCTLRKS